MFQGPILGKKVPHPVDRATHVVSSALEGSHSLPIVGNAIPLTHVSCSKT